MGVWIPPKSVVVCPNCDKQFEHNKVNGIAIIQAAGDIESRKKMRSRLALDALEDASRRGPLNYQFVRKTILDNFNDLARDVFTIIGLEFDDIEP